MMQLDMRALASTELDFVAGANPGVVAGPNGEGCTDPHDTKPGQNPDTLGAELVIFG
jgi:hypothetical protein